MSPLPSPLAPPLDRHHEVQASGRLEGLPGCSHLDWELSTSPHEAHLSLQATRANRLTGWARLTLQMGEGAIGIVCVEDEEPQRFWWNLDPVPRHQKLIPFQIWALFQLTDSKVLYGKSARSLQGEVEDLVTRVMQLALRSVPAELLDLARRFHEDHRHRALGLFVTEGRNLQQLAASCPGLVSLVAALRCSTNAERAASDQLLALVREGVPLRRLLVLADSVIMQHWAPRLGRDIADARVRRLLLRRIPASLGTGLRLLVPPPGIAPSDVPKEAGVARVYFHIMDEVTRLVGFGQLDDAEAKKLVGFASLHWRSVWQAANRDRETLHTTLAEIVDYARVPLNPCPTRRQAPERVLERVRRWHADTFGRTSLPPHTRLPPWPHGLPTGELSLTQLLTVADLQREARAQQHCVASFDRRAASGKVFVFRGTVGDERFTLSIVRHSGGLHLDQLAQKKNAPVSARTRQLVREWLAEEATRAAARTR